MTNMVRPTDIEVSRLRRFRARAGLQRASCQLGVAESTLEAVLGGTPVKVDTLARIRTGMARTDLEEGGR